MIKKRIIGCVIVKDGLAVQSHAFHKYLPIGNPGISIENLNRWGADEILILSIDRSRGNLGPDFELLKKISQLRISTPIVYGGGIRNIEDAINVIKYGADRLCLDSLFNGNRDIVTEIAVALGSQAVIISLPVQIINNLYQRVDYKSKAQFGILTEDLAFFKNGIVSEVLLIDYLHEGLKQGFQYEIVEKFPCKDISLIAFGGISESSQFEQLFSNPQVSAIGVGNFLSFHEHAIQSIKEKLIHHRVRLPFYQGDSH